MADIERTPAEYEQQIGQLNQRLNELNARNNELRTDHSILTQVHKLQTIYDDLDPDVRAAVLINSVKFAIKDAKAQLVFENDTAHPTLQTADGGKYYGKDNTLQDLKTFSRASLEQLNILGKPIEQAQNNNGKRQAGTLQKMFFLN